jgi:hypothetical protein
LNGDFREVNGCGVSLAAGATCNISVIFTPTATGQRSGTLTISDNALKGTQAVNLSGSGVALLNVMPSSLRFGQVMVGKSLSKTITLSNFRSFTIKLTGFTFTGADSSDFSQTNNCGTGLAGGKSCTVTVVFKPLAKGQRSANLKISVGGRVGTIPLVPLSGSGT